jgi:ABC-type nitrate/sulfonate/bicarbonate transport system permease component
MGTPGLGQSMNKAETFGLNDQIYALALATGLLGVTIHFAVTGLEKRVLRWHPSQRKGTA